MLQYMFIISGTVIGSVICHYIIKWLDSIQERLAQIKSDQLQLVAFLMLKMFIISCLRKLDPLIKFKGKLDKMIFIFRILKF